MKLNIIGNIFGIDGYSNHTRQLANALDKESIEVSLTTQIPQGWERVTNDRELIMLKRDSSKADVNLMIGMPNQWLPFMCDDKPFIGFCVWEGDKIPLYWIDILMDKRVTQVWVPSMHTKDAIQNTLTENNITMLDKVHIVPHGCDLDIFYKMEIHDGTT